jgi:hypothetical protein
MFRFHLFSLWVIAGFVRFICGNAGINGGIAGGLVFNSTSRARLFGREMNGFLGCCGFCAVALHKLSCGAQYGIVKSISWIAFT